MSAISETFEICRADGRAALVPSLTAGDPDLATTAELLHAVAAGGADLVGLRVPFSDPIVDGPVKQRSAERALESGTTISGVLRLVAHERERLGVPVVLSTYYNPIHKRGAERFAEQAESSGVDGVLCFDLPVEEGGALAEALERRGIDPIYQLAPTSTRRRVQQVDAVARGFVYYLSRTGVTGRRETLPRYLLKQVKRLRRKLHQPLAVGLGISTPEQVAELAAVADGVVIGSALVELIELHRGSGDLAGRMEREVRRLRAGLER